MTERPLAQKLIWQNECASKSLSLSLCATMATESAVKVSPDMQPEHAVSVTIFFEGVGVNSSLPAQLAAKDACSNLLRDLLRADRIERGKITCSFTVEPVIANIYGGLHGGAVAAIAERVSIACARTVVAQNKEIFLGELSISYLSAAGKSAGFLVHLLHQRRAENDYSILN
ncbi:hypothetical protein CDL15_Pgr003646 [Punica granatum]|uniref:Acyl-coenzyme A thioesterase 13-like n=1 Tax=Punica granatum TaxID=22663 RepID=A0A218XTG7_PUNGR|nr:hypothetical protein CDL15_Pgr003646 [Punica granatum]